MADVSSRGGLFASLRGLLATGVGILQTRLELLAVELQEERARLLGLAGFGAVALIFLSAGLVFLAILLTVLLWEGNRLLVLGIFSALFLGGGGVALAVAFRYARAPSRLFAASLAELQRDRAAADAATGDSRP
jgi:uncharacterized membrane protein YqjE